MCLKVICKFKVLGGLRELTYIQLTSIFLVQMAPDHRAWTVKWNSPIPQDMARTPFLHLPKMVKASRLGRSSVQNIMHLYCLYLKSWHDIFSAADTKGTCCVHFLFSLIKDRSCSPSISSYFCSFPLILRDQFLLRSLPFFLFPPLNKLPIGAFLIPSNQF